jgi:ABC transport system ATP-binding/permease protein
MHYLSAEGLTKSYGIKPLFSNVSFHISEGDKIALVARNGSGKSTLLRILAGQEVADEGKLWINKSVTVALFEQDPVFDMESSVIENIFLHDHPVVIATKEYEEATESGDHTRIAAAITKMDELNAWQFEQKVTEILHRLKITQFNQAVSTLSGGQKKRVALAKTLIDIGFEPTHVLLIMDEPTNHLDVEMVEWLESYLNKEKITLLLVTHDRYFLETVCAEIWELDNSTIYTYKGDYQNYLDKKLARQEAESASIDKAKNLYRKELEWIRKQPKARTTKSKSRVDAFSEVEAKAKSRIAEANLELQMKMTRLGGKVVEMKKVYKSYPGKPILQGFDYTFKKGERIGIIGRNGTGKSTFLNILQGIDQPDSGKVNIGETVVFGNYSQTGLQIKEDQRLIEYVKNIAEHFPLANGGSLSASQFLQLFLFPPEQQYTYISSLSGGERRRLHLLSVLFTNPNFLVLDEPTNDLDLPTLTVLEEFLSDFAGCLVIVSHDRFFMDRLVDHLFVFEGEGKVRDFPGNYTLYRSTIHTIENDEDEPVRNTEVEAQLQPAKRKFSFKEKREFETLQDDIRRLDQEKQKITAELSSGNLPFAELETLSKRIVQINAELDAKEMRWLELSEIAG